MQYWSTMVRLVALISFLYPNCFNLIGQNLIPNPGFESYSNCPTTISELDLASPWVSPTAGTPDFFHACNAPCIDPVLSPICVPLNYSGFQEAHGGNGYAGFYTYEEDNYREYIQAPLISPLEAGSCYEVSFYVSSSDPGMLGVKGLIGAYFSENAVSINDWTPLDFVSPQVIADSVIDDANNWVLISKQFEAQGGESYITIGHFSDNANTVYPNPTSLEWYESYFIIDDVSVTLLSTCSQDTSVTTNDPPVTASPLVSKLVMPNTFTPNGDGLNDFFIPITFEHINDAHLTISNRWGNPVFETSVPEAGWNGIFGGNDCSEGVYFWEINYSDVSGGEQTKHGFVTLQR